MKILTYKKPSYKNFYLKINFWSNELPTKLYYVKYYYIMFLLNFKFFKDIIYINIILNILY